MPPNTGSGSILDQFECSYKQAANPYSDTKHACFEECPGTSGSGGTREHETPEPAVDDTVRVTTRARLTYELYTYSKNAMLIVTTLPDAYVRTGVVDILKNTFEMFRFEVEVGIAADRNELYKLCDTFFEKDFTEYGAVGLVIVTPMGVNRRQPGLKFEKRFFKESVVLDNFRLNRNPTLADKPKIYITEARRGMSDPPLKETMSHGTHDHVISFHLPGTYEKAVNKLCNENKLDPEDVLEGPIKIFCDKLSDLGDIKTVPEIIYETFEDFFDKYSVFNPRKGSSSPVVRVTKNKIEVVNTLKKELYLARVADQ